MPIRWIANNAGKKNIQIIGATGDKLTDRKTFLAKCIGVAAGNANKKVLFISDMDMINQLIAADVDHNLVKKLYIYTSIDHDHIKR